MGEAPERYETAASARERRLKNSGALHERFIAERRVREAIRTLREIAVPGGTTAPNMPPIKRDRPQFMQETAAESMRRSGKLSYGISHI